MTTTTETTTSPPDRDEKGRFLKGCAGGPGNPDGKRLAKLRSVLLRSVSEQDVARAVDRLIALTGDADPKVRLLAIRELLDRTIGKPRPAEPTIDHDEAAEKVAVADTLDYDAVRETLRKALIRGRVE